VIETSVQSFAIRLKYDTLIAPTCTIRWNYSERTFQFFFAFDI